MKRAALLFAVCAACSLTPARADIGPPAGKKSVPVTTVVEATEAFPDYAFFETSYSSTPGPPPHGGSSSSVTFHFFVPGTTMTRTGDRRSGGGLYALPRAEAEKIPGWKGYEADAAKYSPNRHGTVSASEPQLWFKLAQSVKKGKIPGATAIRFGGSEDVPTDDARHVIAETYRIVRTPDEIAFVNPDDPARTGKSPADGDPAPAPRAAFPWALVAAGAAACAAILLTGLWLVMRRRAA